MTNGKHWARLDAALLRDWSLPAIPGDADKEIRGQVLIVAGSREIPGAALLAALAAMRAGAGKLAIATAQSIAQQLAIAVPEARVIALPENAAGSFAVSGLKLLEDCAGSADAVLIGPGLMDEQGTTPFVRGLLERTGDAPVILDALALNAAKGEDRLGRNVLLTPHAGEMAKLLARSKESVLDDPHAAAEEAALSLHAVVALKGAITLIADGGERHWQHEAGHPGLATSGSGDVLAGLIAGLAARSAPLAQAAAWGVVLHSMAGGALARRLGSVGYLARELPGEIPALMEGLSVSRLTG